MVPSIAIICRDGSMNSFVSNFVVAMELKKIGADVSVILIQEALSAIVKNKSEFSSLLREDREKILENLKKKGIPANPTELIKAARNSGVKVFACSAWVKLLEIDGKLPPEIVEISLSDVVKIINEAEKVVGSL